MGLYLHEYFKNKAELGLWNLTENEKYYTSKLVLNTLEKDELSKIKGKRRIQWLGVRYLLHHMTGRSERAKIIKDENGKPYLENSNFSISLSHTDQMVAVYASPEKIGVDIQKIEDKIIKISPKFLHENEVDYIDLNSTQLKEILHVIWGAKEAIYKATNRKGGSFKENIIIDTFEMKNEGQTKGKLVFNDEIIKFNIYFRHVKNNILVMAVKV